MLLVYVLLILAFNALALSVSSRSFKASLVFQAFAVDLAVTVLTSAFVLSTIVAIAAASARTLSKLIKLALRKFYF